MRIVSESSLALFATKGYLKNLIKNQTALLSVKSPKALLVSMCRVGGLKK